jgi:ribosomal protein L11 methyltransferase
MMVLEPFIESLGEHRLFWLRKPRKIGERLLIARKGARIPESGRTRTVIVLEVDRAFGTGGHGTTEGCLRALEAHLLGGESVLDLGTGTGILAIAARKLGAGAVTAADIDRAACREARRNVALNGLADGIVVVEGAIQSVSGPFDVVVANLRTPLLAGLLEELVRRLREGGTAILSGILEREQYAFVVLLDRFGLATVEMRGIAGWMTVVAVRRRSPVPPPAA